MFWTWHDHLRIASLLTNLGLNKMPTNLLMTSSKAYNGMKINSGLGLYKISTVLLMTISNAYYLTHWGHVTHTCVSKLGHHWFRYWLVAWSPPSHYLHQCWNIVNCTLTNKLKWNLNRNSYNFNEENAVEYIIWEMAAILCQPQYLKIIDPDALFLYSV